MRKQNNGINLRNYFGGKDLKQAVRNVCPVSFSKDFIDIGISLELQIET